MIARYLKSLFGFCIATILTVAGPVTADTPPAHPPLPNMRAFPTSLQDAKFPISLSMQASVLRSSPSHLPIEKREVVSPTSRRMSPLMAHAPQSVGRSARVDEKATDKVLVCQKIANIPLGGLAAKFGKYHQWLVIEDRNGKIVHAAGLGTQRGVPEANGRTSPDLPYTKTYIVDHSKEPTSDCRYVSGIDSVCVQSQTPLGKAVGPWVPHFNDCNQFVQRVIGKCDKSQNMERCGQSHDAIPCRNAIPPRSGARHSDHQTVKRATRR